MLFLLDFASYIQHYFRLTEKLTERINCIPLYEWIISRHRTIIRTMNKWLDDFSKKISKPEKIK